jgi:hypothetical protein
LKVDTRKEGNKHQSFDVKYRTIKLNLLEQVAATNATLSGKKLLAKIVNGVKQPTVFCPFERLVRLVV